MLQDLQYGYTTCSLAEHKGDRNSHEAIKEKKRPTFSTQGMNSVVSSATNEGLSTKGPPATNWMECLMAQRASYEFSAITKRDFNTL